jgi:hypothetical protein
MKKITRGLIWFGSFKGKELNVKVYDVSGTKGRTDDNRRQVTAKSHLALGQVS